MRTTGNKQPSFRLIAAAAIVLALYCAWVLTSRSTSAQIRPPENRPAFIRPDWLQSAIDASPANGTVPGAGWMGGVIDVPRGRTRLPATLKLRTGVTLRGQGAAASILECDDTVIELSDGGSGNGPANITIEGMTIRSGRGGGIRFRPGMTGEPGQLVFRDLIIDVPGVGIDLTGLRENHVTYRPDFERVDFKNPGAAAIRGPVRMCTLDVCVIGKWRGGQVPRALIDLWGMGCAVDARRAWLESELPENCRMFRVEGGTPGYEAKVSLGVNSWPEPKNAGHGTPFFEFVAAYVTAPFVNPSADYPIALLRGSRLDVYVAKPSDSAPLSRALKCDATSLVREAGRTIVEPAPATQPQN